MQLTTPGDMRRIPAHEARSTIILEDIDLRYEYQVTVKGYIKSSNVADWTPLAIVVIDSLMYFIREDLYKRLRAKYNHLPEFNNLIRYFVV